MYGKRYDYNRKITSVALFFVLNTTKYMMTAVFLLQGIAVLIHLQTIMMR